MSVMYESVFICNYCHKEIDDIQKDMIIDFGDRPLLFFHEKCYSDLYDKLYHTN